jgi:hypothetical protein
MMLNTINFDGRIKHPARFNIVLKGRIRFQTGISFCKCVIAKNAV